jgi:bifunctional non-homologous end joining protein LigD
MLLRPGAIPTGPGWAFELKYDGFRALVSTENGLEVRSRRSWQMTERVPELGSLPTGLVLDGELVAFNQTGAPDWPLLCGRMLHGNPSVAVTFIAFDVLRVDGHDLTRSRWDQRRAVLEELGVETRCSRLADVFDDGQVLFNAVCEHGLEGIVAKRRDGLYRPAHRGWVKVKNPDYWRREAELASVTRTLQRRSVAA